MTEGGDMKQPLITILLEESESQIETLYSEMYKASALPHGYNDLADE